MLITVATTALGIVLFLCAILGFYTGLRIGYRIAKGTDPPQIKGPVKAVQEVIQHKQTEKQEKEELDYWEQIERNDGFTPQERTWMGKGG